MRRFGQLMTEIATWQNVALAFRKASARSKHCSEVAAFRVEFEQNVNTIVEELVTGTWHPGRYLRFVVRDPKVRLIHAAPFRDRVVHHALMNIAGPCLERGAVDATFACRKGRGNRAAVQHAAKLTRRYRYFLKLDVRRYFDSVQQETLSRLLHRRFKDAELLKLLDRILNSFQVTTKVGLPIGTLTSQYFANFYLDGLDHLAMESFPCPAYVRYMDDIVLWHNDADVLEGWLDEIGDWLMSERGLSLKGQPIVTECRDGLPFLGCRITPRGMLLSRTSRHRFAQRLACYERDFGNGVLTSSELQRRVDALLSFTDFANCKQWRRTLMNKATEARDNE